MKGKLKDILIVINGNEMSLKDILRDFGFEYGFTDDGETLLSMASALNDNDKIDIKIKKKRGK